MTHNFMKMAGVKSERDFYAKYPTEKAFFDAFPKARDGYRLKKAIGRADDGITTDPNNNKNVPPPTVAPSGMLNTYKGNKTVVELGPDGKNHVKMVYKGRPKTGSPKEAPDPSDAPDPDDAPDAPHTGDGLFSGGYEEGPGKKMQFPKIPMHVQANQASWNPFAKNNAWNPAGGTNIGGNDLAFASTMIAGALPYQPINANNAPLKPMDNPYAYGTGSHAAFKNGGKIGKFKKAKKAENGLTSEDMNNWNAFHSYQAQNNPNYGMDTLNHGTIGQDSVSAWNKANPTQQINKPLTAYQQGFNEHSTGVSPVDNFAGSKTLGSSFTNYERVNIDKNGVAGPVQKFGTNAQAFQNADPNRIDAARNTMQTQPQVHPQVQQPVFATGQQPRNMAFPTREEAIAKHNAGNVNPSNFYMGNREVRQQGRMEAKVAKNRQMETEKMQKTYAPPGEAAYGASIIGNSDLHIEDDQFVPLSSKTLALTGKTHEQEDAEGNTGVKVAYNGQVVEGQGAGNNSSPGEPISLGKDGSLTFWGKMNVPGTKTTFEQAAKIHAKEEKKVDKVKNRATTSVTDNDPSIKTQKYAFNAGTVLQDAAEQKTKAIEDSKEHLAMLQEKLLDLADHTGLDPKVVAKKFGGKAKFGVSIPKADSGHKMNAPLTPEEKADFEAMQKEDPDQYRNLYTIGRKNVKPGGKNDLGLYGPGYDNLKRNFKHKTVAEEPDFGNVPETIHGRDPYEGAPDLGFPIGKPEQGTSAMPSGTAPSPKAKVPPKRSFNPYREKMGLMDYLPAVRALLDQPEMVPTQQYNPNYLSGYQVSFDDRRQNAQSDFNAIQKTMKNNPAALAAISAQKNMQDVTTSADEFRTNQGITNDVWNKNQQIDNQRLMANAQFADTAMARNAQAKAVSDENHVNALKSISDNRRMLENHNNTLAMIEAANHFGYDPYSNQFQRIGDPKYLDPAFAGMLDPNRIKARDVEKTEDASGNTKTSTYTEKAMGGSMGGGMPGRMAFRGMGASETYAQKKKKRKKSSK